MEPISAGRKAVRSVEQLAAARAAPTAVRWVARRVASSAACSAAWKAAATADYLVARSVVRWVAWSVVCWVARSERLRAAARVVRSAAMWGWRMAERRAVQMVAKSAA
jgi:hypothetical protein